MAGKNISCTICNRISPNLRDLSSIILLMSVFNIQMWTCYDGNGTKYRPEGVRVDNYLLGNHDLIADLKGTVPQKLMSALNVHFSEKSKMVPFIWV